jgi:Sulfotransferase family
MLRRLFRKALSNGGVEYDPYDRAVREQLAERMFAHDRGESAPGTLARSRFILDIIQETFPSEELTKAYFENLDALLRYRQPLRAPGRIVLGIGSGRSGSTSLAAMLATIGGSCCTHENPPLISWRPEPEEVEFHLRRFRRLAPYHPFVADVSHWWLNVIDLVFAEFPEARVIGTFREVESCAASFMRIKGSGRGSYNHWVPYDNGIWAAARWDAAYPTFAVPEHAALDPDGVKLELIARYVEEYNDAMQALAQRFPTRVMLVHTETLDDEAVQNAIFDYVGMRGTVARTRLNVGTTDDGKRFRDVHLL